MAQVITGAEIVAASPSLRSRDTEILAAQADMALRNSLRRRVLASEAVTDSITIDRQSLVFEITTRDYPVNSLTAIRFDGVAQDLTKFDKNNRRIWLKSGYFPRNARIEIDYVAGYESNSKDILILKGAAAAIAGIIAKNSDSSMGKLRILELGELKMETSETMKQGDANRWPVTIELMIKNYRSSIRVN